MLYRVQPSWGPRLTLAVQRAIWGLRMSWILAAKSAVYENTTAMGSELATFIPSGTIHSLARTMMRVAMFLAVSAAILQLSWRSPRDLRSHGFRTGPHNLRAGPL